MNNVVEGLVVKQVGGFYYVKLSDKSTVECRARGKFRHEGTNPLVGDMVKIQIGENSMGFVLEIMERKNFLYRPPIANIDCLFLVISFTEPLPNTVVIDKLIAIAKRRNIELKLIFTKFSIENNEEIVSLYKNIGYDTFVVDSKSGYGLNRLREIFEKDKIYVFSGNSGVGKSSLLNAIFGELSLSTSDISKKLGRGRHTTRHSEMFEQDGFYVVDTPGFSAIDFAKLENLPAEELDDCFVEFAELKYNCKFTGCSHVTEKGCEIIKALKEGAISQSRYDSYCAMYAELREVPEWKFKSKQ